MLTLANVNIYKPLLHMPTAAIQPCSIYYHRAPHSAVVMCDKKEVITVVTVQSSLETILVIIRSIGKVEE